jgi:hypothetical protein
MARTVQEIEADMANIRGILAGGRSAVEYRGRKVQNYSAAELREILAELRAERSEASGGGRAIYFATSKGL